MPTYILPLNVVLFLGSFWTALIYAIWTHDLLGAALLLSMGVGCLTSRRLTPPRSDDD